MKKLNGIEIAELGYLRHVAGRVRLGRLVDHFLHLIARPVRVLGEYDGPVLGTRRQYYERVAGLRAGHFRHLWLGLAATDGELSWC